ncbi:MAG TPA: DUF3570 domain-containing protein [Candidatus Eisenbacteria bacterium]
MQLTPGPRGPALRNRLGAAACLLFAAGAGVSPARAENPPRWQFDASGLIYGESQRASVVEPTAKITRLFPDGQRLSAALGIDVITGASPTGALPSGDVQTVTTPSGNVTTHAAGEIPTKKFKDTRGVLDLGYEKPFAGWLTATAGGHFSREKDYQSLGLNGTVAISFLRRLSTLTLGAGMNDDDVFPVGGTRAPLTDGSVVIGTGWNPKRVRSGMVGLSRILTRRWMIGANVTRTLERGDLTDPYKVLSVVDASTGMPVGQLTESRPGTRDRRDVYFTSVYHLERDVTYASYRRYWDDWGVHSNTIDLKYRRELENHAFLQPHVRYYFQTRATFFREGLVQGEAVPRYATSDVRLGDLRTLTLGGTYGFQPPGSPGEFTIRGEYMRQWGRGAEEGEGDIGEERQFDLSPPVDIGSLVLTYSVAF